MTCEQAKLQVQALLDNEIEEQQVTPLISHLESCYSCRNEYITFLKLQRKMAGISIPEPPKEWFEGVLRHHDISVIGLDLEICLKATELPPIHRNPCDRFVIATAMLKEIPVVTADRRFTQYGIEILT